MEVTLPNMEIWQKDVLNYYIENPKNKWIVVKAIRLVGKSILAEILLVYASLAEENSVSIIVSPVFSLSKKIYDEISNWAGPIIKRSNGSDPSITFINGSKILFKSAVQGDNIRGNTCKKGGILIVDEASFIDEDFFYSVCTPLVNVFKNDIFLFSTPKFKQGAFYQLYTDGELGTNPMIKSFDWTVYDTSKYLSKETLEIYRKLLPKSAFASEYLGEWISGDGAVFNEFKKCIGPAAADIKQRLIIGIDWATGNGGDDTVLTLGLFVNGKIQVLDIIAFNDKNANDTVDIILATVKKKVNEGFKEIHIVVEKNSIGNVFGDILRQELGNYEDTYNEVDWRNQIGITFLFFITSNSSKEKIIKQLCVLFENDKIVLPNNSKLINQLSIYEVSVSAAGNCIYNAPNRAGCHDDTIMSLAIMANSLYAEVKTAS